MTAFDSAAMMVAMVWVVTDRWQRFTQVQLTPQTLDALASCCAEFLVHGVEVEGRGRRNRVS